MVSVPSEYDTLIKQMSKSTGIPYNVIAEQANLESGFQATAKSNAGALGWLQFLPGTYNSVAARAGVKQGSEFDPASEAKAYDVYMSDLLKQEGGDLRKALAAYNAGPGNLPAGYSYADSILSAAKTGNITVAGGSQPASASTTSLIPGISVSGLVESAINQVLKMLGISGGLKDMFERFGLIILGFALVILGIHLLSGGGSGSGSNVTVNEPTREEGSSSKSSSASRSEVKTASKKQAEKTGAEEAVEAAAIA
jgi:Transglycosylase SLT domain